MYISTNFSVNCHTLVRLHQWRYCFENLPFIIMQNMHGHKIPRLMVRSLATKESRINARVSWKHNHREDIAIHITNELVNTPTKTQQIWLVCIRSPLDPLNSYLISNNLVLVVSRECPVWLLWCTESVLFICILIKGISWIQLKIYFWVFSA